MPTDANQNHPVLPQLKEKPTITGFNHVGVWDSRHPTELANLSNDIKIEKVGIDINSIPDIWARPLSFEMALTDTDHLLNKRVLAEWRGLLAMIALKEVAHIDKLRVVPISIPISDEALKMAPAFLRAAANLLPTSSVDTDTSWHSIYVFLYDNKPIGMTSPTVLVVTATNYFNAIIQAVVPWFDGRLLLDPTKKIVDDTIGKAKNPNLPGTFMSDTQKGLLAGWLKKLNDALHTRSTTSGTDGLFGLIECYINDLGFTLENAPTIEQGTSLEMTQGMFSLIDRPVRAVQHSPALSAVRLMESRTVPVAPSRSILVVDKEIAEQWGMDETDITVWRGKTLRTSVPHIGFPDEPPAEKNKLGETEVPDAEVWAPKWFFKKYLYVIGRENALPGAVGINLAAGNLKYSEQTVTPILPLDEILVDYLTVDDFATRVVFEQRNEGILVTLKLKLSGPNQKGKEFLASHLYRRQQGDIKLLEGVPVLEVWPDFKAPGWKANYTYYDQSAISETFDAMPYTPGAQSEEGRISEKQRITRTDHYPEAVICTVSEVREKIGFLLIKQPRSDKNPIKEEVGIEYKVGIDFGATGTNIYFKVGDQNPHPFELNERYVSVTSPKNRNVIYDNCLPANTEKTPFLSIFKKFPNGPAENLRPLLDSIIYFPSDTFSSSDPSITYNLKWSDQATDTHKVEAFLKQIALQVAAEAVNAGARSIAWYYSFPTAFGVTRRENFSDAWAAVVANCAALTGVTSLTKVTNAMGSPSITTLPKDETESIAAAKYFRDPQGHSAPTNIGAVFIDIGGSTSDIAIWQGNLLWQTSILLAGRDIFLDFLHDNLQLLKGLKSDIDLKPLEEAKGISQTSFYAQIDHLLRRDGENLLNNLRHAASESQKLKQVVAVGISGIFFYVGLILRHLKNEEKYREEIPSFYIGGNGSQMFRWLTSGGPFTSTSAANSVLERVFFKASGLMGDSLTIEISKKPKAEAAFGLVCDTTINSTTGANDKQVLAGETFIQDAQEKSWDTMLATDADAFDISVPQNLEKLDEFIVAFNEAAGDAELLQVAPNVNARAALLNDVRNLLSNNINSGEPIFILALKGLLRRLRN